MGHNVGQRCLAVGQYRTACGSPATRILCRLGASHVTRPRTHHEVAEQPPTAAKEEPVNTQRSDKETHTKFFSRHVGRTTNVHEEVGSGKASIQEGKEAASHTNGQQ
jgi:hypothetical protein